MADANFDGARLTDVKMTTAELARSSFREAVLVRTDFSMSGLGEVRFADAALTDVAFRKTDLRRIDLRALHASPASTSPTRICAASTWTARRSPA